MAKREKLILTDAVASSALRGPVQTFLWDTKLSGFGLRVEPSGGVAIAAAIAEGRVPAELLSALSEVIKVNER